MSDDFQRELTFLGMESSPSFVREPEGNGCAERFVRTLKEQLLWVRSFATAAELAEALGEFKRTYNEQWVIRRHGHGRRAGCGEEGVPIAFKRRRGDCHQGSPRPENLKAIHEFATRFERERGCLVESVEKDNKGYDLISRLPHPEDPRSVREVRFIEVKGRAGVGEIALTENEFKTARRLGAEYWLYVVFNCSSKPQLVIVRDPARMDWRPVVQVEHYRIDPEAIRQGADAPSGSGTCGPA